MAIADRKITSWMNPITGEEDRPNKSAADMKTAFDSNSNQLKDALNGVIDDVELAAETIKSDQGVYRFLRGDGTYQVPVAGEAANGIPSGGAPGKVVRKKSGADFDVEWGDAEAQRLQFSNVTVPVASFAEYTASDAEETALAAGGFVYRAAVALTGVLATMTPDITPGIDIDDCGATIWRAAQCYAGGIYLYADAVPSAAFTLLTVKLEKAVS